MEEPQAVYYLDHLGILISHALIIVALSLRRVLFQELLVCLFCRKAVRTFLRIIFYLPRWQFPALSLMQVCLVAGGRWEFCWGR